MKVSFTLLLSNRDFRNKKKKIKVKTLPELTITIGILMLNIKYIDIFIIVIIWNKKLDENRIIYFPAESIKILGKKNLVKLRDIVRLITNQKDLKVLLEGHSSNDGDSLTNLKLSRERAIIIKQTLIDLGTDPDRIKIKALGEEEPIFDNKSINGKRFNRSVLITIYKWM